MPRTIALDINGDLDLHGGTINFLEAGASIVQGCRIALQFFQGEWFLDTTAGVPYWQQIFGVKSPDTGVLSTLFRQALLDVEGVTDVLTLSVNFNATTRALAVAYRVDTDAGILDGSVSI